MIFQSFPSIEQFRNVIRAVKEHSQYVGKDANGDPIFDYTKPLPKLKFQGTVKLHGTNSAISRNSDGAIHYQSRSRIITSSDDNAGFAADMSKIDLSPIWNLFNPADSVVVYGEYAGCFPYSTPILLSDGTT